MAEVTSLTALAISKRASRFEGKDWGSGVSFFATTNVPGEGASLHRHPYTETFIVLEGNVTFTVDGEKVDAEGGQVVVVPAGAAHGFVNSGDGVLRQVGIHASPEIQQEWLEEEN